MQLARPPRSPASRIPSSALGSTARLRAGQKRAERGSGGHAPGLDTPKAWIALSWRTYATESAVGASAVPPGAGGGPAARLHAGPLSPFSGSFSAVTGHAEGLEVVGRVRAAFDARFDEVDAGRAAAAVVDSRALAKLYTSPVTLARFETPARRTAGTSVWS